MEAQKEQIAPEIIQALIAQAAASGLTVNDYLARLLGLTNGHDAKPSLAGVREETPQCNEAMLAVLQRSAERMKDLPVSGSTEETLKMIRRARGGEMWGYDYPTDADTE